MTKPVFCPSCKNCNTFERKPEKDVLMGNEVFEEAWVCKVCDYKTLRQVEEGDASADSE